MDPSVGSRIYRLLLHLLPSRFRADYASEMQELFGEALEAHRRRSRAAWLLAWVRGSTDVLRIAVRLRRRNWPRNRPAPRERLPQSLLEDFKFAIRTLGRRPLFTTVSVLTLGLGIGASTAMFSVVDGVLLKPLSYDEPDRLVAIWQTRPSLEGLPGDDGARWDRFRLTYAQYRLLSERSTVYEGVAAYRAGAPDVATLTGVGDPVELSAGAASASLLTVLGVRLTRGRWFLPGEDASPSGSDGAAVAVISHDLWRGRFGGSPGTVGRTVTIDDRPFTIVGVLPPGFRVHWLSASVAGEGDPGRRDVWLPIGAPGWKAGRHAYSWETVGRLAAGVTPRHASVETERILKAHPDTDGDARVIPRADEETRGLAPPLVLLFGATGILLLIACGNIATLTAAELQGRRHELATRAAIGAGTRRILRLLLTESALLALMGSTVGIGLAFEGTEALVALAPAIPRVTEVTIDARVLGFALAAGAFTVLLVGAAPAVLASRSALGPGLLGSARTTAGRQRFTSTVVAAEIAMTAVLLVASGLLTRSISRLLAVDPGFEADGLVTVEVRLPISRYPTPSSRTTFFYDALDRLEAIPVAGSVTAVSRLPFPGHSSGWGMRILGRNGYFVPLGYQVAPGYLETLGVPLLAGRSLAETDGPGAPLTVVINETMARRYWPDRSPIGARFFLGGPDEPASDARTVSVVGIVGDMKRQALSAGTEPAFFIPFGQLPDETICFVARAPADPRKVVQLMREALTSLDGDLVVKNATTVAALVAQSAGPQRYRTLLMGVFGLLATLLASAGVVGVTARSVSLRTQEMAIRMALGARGSELVGTTVRSSMSAGLAGIAVGLAGALGASTLLRHFLFGIEPYDAPTYGVVAAALILVCLSASYLPARRIPGVNPVDVLKAD